MASFLHQLKVLLWKNWLGVYRQPLWSVVLIFWPVVIFIILAITRAKFAPTQAPNSVSCDRHSASSTDTGQEVRFSIHSYETEIEAPILIHRETGFLFTHKMLCQLERQSVGHMTQLRIRREVITHNYSHWLLCSQKSPEYRNDPFLQNFLCETDTKCSSRPFTSNTDLSTRLEKRSVDSGGDGSISQMRSSNDHLETLWDRIAGENFGNILNNIEVVKTAVKELSSGDAKGAFCTVITLLSTTKQSTFQVFCSSNQTLTSLALQALFSQASGSDTLTTIYKISTKIQNVQNNEVIWNILLMLPEWIKKPSLIFEVDLNLFFSKVNPEIADVQSCITYLVKTANQVRNQSSTNNPRRILEIVLDQSMGNDMKSCISFFQKVSCGSSPSWLNTGNTFEKIYWLISSLTDGTSSDVCEFNGLNITCNGTINLDMVLQSVLTVVNGISHNSSAVIIRILGQILTSFQESGLQNVFIQSVQSELHSLSSEEQKILQNFLSMVASAINKTISDTALQPPSYNNNLVFNIVENIMKNFAMEGLGGNKNITELIFSLVTDILQIAQNWNNVSLAIAFPQNGYNEAVKELEGLLNNLLSQNSADKNLYYNYSTTILKAFAAFFAKGEKDQVMQTIQYLLNLSNDTINVPALVNTLENFYDLLNLNKTVDLNLLELYIKQLFSFISSSQINQTNSDFSFLFNMSQKLFSLQTSEISHAALELLPFFYPSNLYNISKSSHSLVPTLLNVLSKNVPHDQQLASRNFTDTILSLMELIVKCSNDSTACDSAVSGFEVLTINVVNVINNMGNGTLNLEISNETLMELETLTDLQISLINNIFSLFWNVQNTTDNLSGDLKNIYQDILLATQLILKVTKNLNASTVQSDLEMLKNYTNLIGAIQKVATVNNITDELLQIMNLQKDFQCTNQTLLCIVNLTSQFLDFLQALQLPKPLMEQVLAASSIAEYWLREINTTADVYQQMVSLYELTRATLQYEPTLQTILWTLTDISKIIQDMKMDNTSFPIEEDLILNIFRVLEEGNLLSSSKSPLHINSTLLENVQAQIKIIEWYMIHIKNLTENHNMSGDPYALYRLIQISLIDIMASVQNWVQFSDMSNLSSHEIKNLIKLLTTNETGNWSQLENLTQLLDILQQINSIQGLNTVDITKIWQVINKIMAEELSATQIDEIVKVLEASITTHNITENAELQLYNFILKILNQTYSIGNMNLTQFFQSSLDSFLAMDCQGVSTMSTAVYKMILNTTKQTSPWMDEMFFSNFTLDFCTLLHWNNSQDDWLTLLQASGGLMSYVVPLVPDSMSKYVNVAEYILVVAAEFLAEPDLTQKNVMNILNVVPAISKLFNTSAMDWVQNRTFQKLIYFLVDLAWTSSSPKDVLLLKVQNFTITMVQDIQDMLKTQPASPYNAWMTFALEVVVTIINGTQDPSSEERLLKQVWDLFKQNGLENATISAVNDLVLNKGSVSSQDAKLLDIFPQLVFNIIHSVILDTPLSLSNASTNTTIKVLQMVLSSIIQTFLPQYKNFTLQLGGLQTGMDMTTIFSELQLLLNSIITMQITTNVTNIEANISSLILKYAEIILVSNDSQYIKLFLDAQKIFYEFSQMNTTITVQQLSAIFANYLPMYVGSNNETQAEMVWQLLREMESVNISLILTSINQLQQIIQDIKGLDLGYTFSNNTISAKVFTIIIEGMKIVNNIQAKGTIAKEDIYQIYNFTYLLVQDKQTWVPFQDISAMEAELLDVFYLAMTPFLGGNGSQAYSGNCTAQDVLQILIHTIFKNATVNESQEVPTCNWQFIYNGSDSTARKTHTLGDMIYLALQSSPVFHTVCSKGNLQPLAEEMACLMQVIRLSMSVLAELNNMSGIQTSLIPTLNDSLTYICSNMPQHNSTFQTEIQIMKNLDAMFFNQSNAVHLLIQFIAQHYNSTFQPPVSQQVWTQISKIIKTLVPSNGSVDSHIFELIETAVNLATQPNWLKSWQNLENILSMNWTVSNFDSSLSILETMKRAVVFIDGVMDGKALQIYQAIALLVKNPTFSLLLNATSSQLVNTTMSSVAKCMATVHALVNFSSSVWPIFDQSQSELLSNFGLLACNTLYIQSTNYSWASNLMIISNILSNMANYEPAEMTGYFTAIGKIISLLSEILQSPNISQEILLNRVYELFIQELRLFSNSTIIIDWLENIPVRNLTSILFGSSNNAIFDQVPDLEIDLLHLLSRSLNATSYTQGISVLSDSLMNMANSSSLTRSSGITQQLTNIMTKLIVTVQIPPLTEPYGDVMNCVKYVADDLTDHQTGHLDVAIPDLFTESNELANGSMVTELLNQKIYQLKNLTAILCALDGSNNSQSYCYVPCQYLRALQEVADITTAEIKVKTAQRLSASTIIISLLDRIYTGIEDELDRMISSVIPVSDLLNITTLLTSFLNITNATSGDIQVPLGSLFNDRSHVEDQLRQVVKLSQPSITALMNVPFPSNKTDIKDWFVTLYQCSTEPSLVAGPLQVFCNLSSVQGYQMAIIFLQNVGIRQLSYRFLAPSKWQKIIDILINALESLNEKMNDIFKNMPSREEINFFLNIKQILYPPTNSARKKRSTDFPICSSNTNLTTTPSFTDITNALCKGNYCALSQVFYKLHEDETQSSTNRNNESAQTPDKLYGIPTDDPFCLNIFTNLVKSPNGATKWSLLKPLLYGQILYTPNTTETQKIMETTNNNLLEVQNYQKSANSLSIKIQSLLDNWKYITLLKELIPKLEVILNNTIVEEFLQLFMQLNSTDLSANLTKATSFIPYLIAQESNFLRAQALSKTLSNLLSCTSYNRIQPLNSVTEMMAKAEELQKTNELFAAVTFDLPSSTSRRKRSASGLPNNIKYTISMRSLLSEDTSTLRNSYWTPGPHAGLNKYSRGFVYLQENIDRAIIQMQTNKSMDNVGAQYQPMPYPCYKKNSFLDSMAFSLPIALMITWVIFIASFVKKLVHEKELRLHEYMKMMGINSGSHFFAWLIECASFLIITVAILVLILKFGNILPQSNGFILFLFFLDYSLTIIAMSYFISVFFHNTNVAALSGSLVYIISFFPFIVVVSKETNLSFAGKTLLSLFSPTALSYATQYMIRYEQQNEGIQWHNMYTSPVINDTFCFGWLCWIMLIDAMIYFIVGGYIRTVFPGQYGIAAPWYFPFLPSFWMECCGLQNLFSRKPSGLMISNIVAHGLPDKKGDDLYPENQQEPTDLNVGVSLHGLTKIYKSKAAVDNLNLNFYEGHITSLLGHNGAGKTTTLSMLTGLFSASSGTIHVYGSDIRTHLEQVRKDMGVCMQYDVLFDHLTTKEHLLLYGSIKAPQWDRRQLHEEVKRTLKDTGLYKHRHKPVKTLSGGMKRKLSICIALIGGSKVVILDEPTTGVDPCSRRSIWEVISKNKKDKTIILSTHHLDEAEVLSDRIAFLERGGLKCCGTPRFLKERFGSGYRLTLTKKFSNQTDEDICNTEQVTALIQSHIPEAILKEDVGGELVYVLPPFSTEISVAYLSLLRDLDTSLNDLHIGCYGISDTTIEEVFLKLTDGLDENEGPSPTDILVSNRDHLMVDDESSTNSYSFFDRDDQPLTRMGHVTGFKLLLKKIMAMFIKRFHNSKRNWKGLISQILLPVLFVIAAMGLGSLSMGYVEYPELLLSPELYGSTDQAVVFGISDKRSKGLVDAMNLFPGIDTACLDQNMQCLAANNSGSWNYTGDQTLTYGICSCSTGNTECNAPDAVPPHRMTYSKQMMYNLTKKKMENYLLTTALQFVQKRYGGWSFGIPTSQITSMVPVSENLTLSKVWYNNEGPHSLPSFLNSFSNFLLRANLPPTKSSEYSISVYNKPLPGNVAQGAATATLVNTLVALSVLVGYSITTASFVVYVVKEYHNGSKRLQHIAGIAEACYWLTNFLYDLAIYFIPVALSVAIIAAFKLPPFYEYPNLGAVSLLFILFGYATFSWMYLIAGTFKSPGMAFISYVCINLFIGINTIISSSVVYMLVLQKSPSDKDFQSLNDTYNVLVSFFKIFPQFCFGYGLIVLSQQQAIQDQLEIYGNYEKSDIFRTDILGYMYIAMVVQGTFCFILRLLISDGVIYSLMTFIKKTCLKKYYRVPATNPEEDEDVRAERERVDSGNANADLLLLQGLTKTFPQVKKKLIAVNNMTLGIPPGECFGLLGVNGAGKTTTFKMLTGDISPSSGNIQLRNHFGNLVNVLGFNTDCSSFGYCPQEDALDELMTGEEHLYYYARVHGIPEKRIKLVANQLLQKLQLVQYKDRITANYSCGTRRKLSTALALVGKPSILLLDEPSSGMDPKTKRYLWKIISDEVKDKCAVILTSHSMEECEALCTRLAIMVKGKFQCIGSLQHIKSRFGSGFTVKMHLKDSSISIETITSFMHSHFPNTFLKEQHFTMAEYHVPLSAGGVASIFDLLESNKKDLNVIHFSVSQTTLDEVFINFAQSQSSPDNSRESSQEIPQLVVAI